jgi:membrane protein DedA with SNARE-associated domain
MHHLLEVWFGWVLSGGYVGIIVLMAMESSILPVPSEIVIPPAAYLAGQGQLNIYGVVLAGTFGSWLGAAITYWISYWLGRVVVVRWGRFFFVSEAKLVRAETWLRRYEAGGILFARLLPVIRHLISIPAGIIRMGFGMFSLMTIIGSAVWCSVLAWFGKTAITPEMLRDPESMVAAMKAQSHLIVGGVLVLAVGYFVVMRFSAARDAESPV